LIGRLLTSVFIVSNQFNNAFDIFERQPNFDPSGQISYNLTTNEISGLEHINDFLRSIYDPIENKRDVFLQHLTIHEYELILGFIANTISFVVKL